MKAGALAKFCSLILLPLLIPLFVRSSFVLYVMAILFTTIIGALSLRLLRMTGVLSFAHASFVGIGAYASAILTTKLGLSFWVALPCAGVIAGMIAAVVGIPLIRVKLRGPYFFIATLAFAEIVLLIFTRWISLFGGHSGIIGIPQPTLSLFGKSIVLSSDSALFYLAYAVLILSAFIMHRIHHSRLCNLWRGIRDAELLAESVGVNVAMCMILAFVISCFFAGIAGSTYAHIAGGINPGSFSIDSMMVPFVLYIYAGGADKFAGPILGTVLIKAIGIALRGVAVYETIFYGMCMVLILVFCPQGLTSLEFGSFIKNNTIARAWFGRKRENTRSKECI
jgi:branched-chain amino acid transport system permease protein